MKFVERIKKKARVILRKLQEKIKRQMNKEQKYAEIQKKGNRVILSIKDLVFKERLVKKLTEYI